MVSTLIRGGIQKRRGWSKNDSSDEELCQSYEKSKIPLEDDDYHGQGVLTPLASQRRGVTSRPKRERHKKDNRSENHTAGEMVYGVGMGKQNSVPGVAVTVWGCPS